MAGWGWPHASQLCCDTPPSFGTRFSHAQLFFCRRGCGSVEEGLEVMNTRLGSLESKVSMEEISQ